MLGLYRWSKQKNCMNMHANTWSCSGIWQSSSTQSWPTLTSYRILLPSESQGYHPTPTSQTHCLGPAQCTEFIQICCQLGFKISVHLGRCHGAILLRTNMSPSKGREDEFPVTQWDMALLPKSSLKRYPSLTFFKKNRMELLYILSSDD